MTIFTIRARLLDFIRAPLAYDDHAAYRYIEDGALVVSNGRITAIGEFGDIVTEGELRDLRPLLVMPGFIDLHIHMPQTQVIASYARELLDWLNDYTFPAEAQFADPQHAARISDALMETLIEHGTTTAVAYGSSHPASIDAYFTAAAKRNMCMIGGKTMMDRGAPAAVLDTAQSGYDDSQALISKWHGVGRAHFAITPRFALTSTPAQLEAAGALVAAHPECFVQTHINENHAEIAATMELYSTHKDYMGIYEDYGLLGPKTLLGHCIHMTPREIDVLVNAGAVAVHCPTSNLFLGSGLFDGFGLREAGARIGLATDIGGGTSYSMLRTMDEAFKIQQLRGERLFPFMSYFQATLGNAQALGMEGEIGDLSVGSIADLVALDMNATPAMAMRGERVETLAEELFLLQTMGDDRAVRHVFVAGFEQKST